MATIYEKMTAVCDAIRNKTGGTGKLNLDQMASELNSITDNDSSDLTVSGATVSVPAGHYKDAASKSVATATQATPSISIDSAGKITASATQTAGYVAAGTKSGTKQMTVKAATTWTPKTSNQTIASGTYLTGVQTIKGDSNLTAANIKKGVSIFGVAGSATDLNFTVVGGTSKPSSPAENTIWVNTSTSITSWVFSTTQPTSPSNGMVWFYTSVGGGASFNALKSNIAMIYPVRASQYVSNAWVTKEAQIYLNSQWTNWNLILYDSGNEFNNVTGGWYISKNKSCTFTKNAGSMTIKSDDTAESSAMTMYNTMDIDYSDFNTILVTLSNLSLPDPARGSNLTLVFLSSADPNSTRIIQYTHKTAIAADTTISMSIPKGVSVMGLSIFVYRATATVTKIWME